MDLFEEKAIRPMLINERKDPFDSDDHIYELKLDGIRCVTYLDKHSTDLRNKRDKQLLPLFPELTQMNSFVNKKCILDGEIIVVMNGSPSFNAVQGRTTMTNPFKIKLASEMHPASFVAYDIIYIDGKEVVDLPLLERKQLLSDIINENDRISVSRFIEHNGIALYNLAEKENLEGIVAKRKSSTYQFGKRSKDWIKCKVMSDDDFVVCGYIMNPSGMNVLIIGQYKKNILLYKGHVALGFNLGVLNKYNPKIMDVAPCANIPKGNERAIWIQPEIVVTVEWMPNGEAFRQASLKSFRDDKLPIECQLASP